MKVTNYRELIVWQKAMDLAEEIYKLVKMLPKEELYEMSSQMRRAAVSIPSNIAEGQSRNGRKEFIYFLGIALGSRAELETQLVLCVRVGYLKEADVTQEIKLAEEVSKMLNFLLNKLKIR